MAKILQIRRGTAAQNDIFTGMPGELTFDTDNNTLRVHDGAHVGGYTLARAVDAAGAQIAYDPSVVADEVWRELIARLGPKPYTKHTGYDVPVTLSDSIDFAFATTAEALFARVELVCKADDAGYGPGDVVAAFGVGEYAAPQINIVNNGLQTIVRLMVGEQEFWTPHKTTGVKTVITATNWRLRFNLYC